MSGKRDGTSDNARRRGWKRGIILVLVVFFKDTALEAGVDR